jgi:hypothetical protein
MATRAHKGVPKKKDGSGKGKGRAEAAGRNYLVVASNRKLVVVSGATGKIKEVDPKDASRILKLLKDRQQKGRKICELLG